MNKNIPPTTDISILNLLIDNAYMISVMLAAIHWNTEVPAESIPRGIIFIQLFLSLINLAFLSMNGNNKIDINTFSKKMKKIGDEFSIPIL